MSSNPSVSAIVVNWNGTRHLEVSLPSLLLQSYLPLEVIVVDNASTDGSADVVSYFGSRWLPLPRNLGLAPCEVTGEDTPMTWCYGVETG